MKRFNLLAVFLSVLFLQSCSQLQSLLKDSVTPPSVSYDSFGLGEISLQGVELKPRFTIQNDNAFPLPLEQLTYQVTFNGKQLIAAKVDDLDIIPAKSEEVFTLTIPVNGENFSALKEFLLKDESVDYVISGNMRFLGLKIPFEEKGTLYKPSVRITSMDVTSASFEKLELMLALEITNNNSFDLPMGESFVSMHVSGKQVFKSSVEIDELQEGKTAMNVPVSFKPADLFSSLWEMMKDPKLDLDIQVKTPWYSERIRQTLNLADLL